MIRRLEWDSEFFGLRIGRVDVANASDWVTLKGELTGGVPYELVYVFDNSLGKPLIENAKLVDTKVVYRKQLEPACYAVGNILHYECRFPDDELYDLALISGGHSRYKLDTCLPAGSYERLYRRWIENSVNGEMADAVFCFYEQGKKLGMITLKIKGDYGSIGLIAVGEASQGRGIGTQLIKYSEAYLYNRGVRVFDVATQMDNDGGCGFYERSGFVKYSATRIYHLWL